MKKRYMDRLGLVCILLFIGGVFVLLFGCSEKPEPAKVSQERVDEKNMETEPPAVVESVPAQTLSEGEEEKTDIPPEPVASNTPEGIALPEVIHMDNKAYTEHTKAIVLFTHQKHMDEYVKAFPEFFKDGCGTCHHDANNQPLVLKAGDAVQGCIECHDQPGERPKGADAPTLSKEERLAYHAEALHYNCKGCHSDVNEATGTKDAPTTCSKCHAKQA